MDKFEVIEVMNSGKFGVLGIESGGWPYISVVEFAVNDEFEVVMLINVKSEKGEHLQGAKRASFIFFTELEDLLFRVFIQGDIIQLDKNSDTYSIYLKTYIEKIQDAYKFLLDPLNQLYVLKPLRIRVAKGLEQIFELG